MLKWKKKKKKLVKKVKKHNLGQLYSGIWCWQYSCEDKVKHGLLSKRLDQRKQEHSAWKWQSITDKLLQKVMSSGHHME